MGPEVKSRKELATQAYLEGFAARNNGVHPTWELWQDTEFAPYYLSGLQGIPCFMQQKVVQSTGKENK